MKTMLLQPSWVAAVLQGAHACAPAAAGPFGGTAVPGARTRTDVDVPFPPPRGAPV